MKPIEKKIIDLIDQNREKIIAFAKDIETHPELGYKEIRTAAKVAEQLEACGLKTEKQLAITGVKASLKKSDPAQPTVALIGELDAVRVPAHPCADPVTGAAHACGHHAQLAGIIGAAIALTNPEVCRELDGNVVFFAVPSEEYGEVEYKNGLKEQGLLRYGGGKSELIRIGAFDGIDLAVTHHSLPGHPGALIGNCTSNGFVSKIIRIKGRGAHAAAAPERGINGLNAASIGLSALAYQRETFRDEDAVRVHPIITKGGDLVNVVPEEVTLETLVRAKSVEAIRDADRKTDRSFQAGALAVGAQLELITVPGYLPKVPLPPSQLMEEAAMMVLPPDRVERISPDFHDPASTDVGDLTHIMPVLNFQTGGVRGVLHGSNMDFFDPDTAYLATAKIFALTAYRLMCGGALEAKQTIKSFCPVFTKQQYLDYMDSFEKTERFDYRD